jgi:hypothetical protein
MMLPQSLVEPLRRQLEFARLTHEDDLEQGCGNVNLPYALERKYPGAAREWGWRWAFPASKLSVDPRSGERRRHHISEDILQMAVKKGQ